MDKFKLYLIYEFNTFAFFINTFIFLVLSYCVYLIQKNNIDFHVDVKDFQSIISLTIYLLTLYGIFFAFLQFLIGNKTEKFSFWGINKIQFSILNKLIYRLVNLFVTRVALITLILIPIIITLIDNLESNFSSDITPILNSVWEVSFLYLIIMFGFLLTQSLIGLFLVFAIENNSDWKIRNKIKNYILKQALLNLKKRYFWAYFDYHKKYIEKDQLFDFTKFIFNGVLKHILSKIPKARQDFYSYHKKSKLSLYSFLNNRWEHVKELSTREKITILKNEIDQLNSFSIFHENNTIFKECLINNENLLVPFHDILSEIKSAENLQLFLKVMNNRNYFDFIKNESELNKISYELSYSIKDNFPHITNDNVRSDLRELNINNRAIANNIFEFCYSHGYENNEVEKKIIKFILNTLDLNYVYAFIFYCVLHYGSSSETALQEELDFFRDLYFSNSELSVIDNKKICNLVEGTNIGHRVDGELISWLLTNMNKDLNNQILEDICNFTYLNYSKFLKIRFIFSNTFTREGRFPFDYFDRVEVKKLEQDNIDEIISSYFAYISSNIGSLNYSFMIEHHKVFTKKFEDDFVSFIENKLKYYNYANKHVILYLLKDVPKVKEYLLSKKFISKSHFGEDIYIDIEDFFIDFILLAFEDTQFHRIFNTDDIIKTKIKKKLEDLNKEGELNDYFDKYNMLIDKCNYFIMTKNYKAKILEYFKINI